MRLKALFFWYNLSPDIADAAVRSTRDHPSGCGNRNLRVIFTRFSSIVTTISMRPKRFRKIMSGSITELCEPPETLYKQPVSDRTDDEQ